jgi:hypothetical protein
MYVRAIDFNEEVDSATLASHLANCLRRVQARSVIIEGNCVTFTGGMLRFVSNWNVLAPFGYGDLTIDSSTHQVQYRISLRQLIVFGTAACGFAFMFMLFARAQPWQLLTFLPLGWVWLVGGNLAIGIPRFNKFIRHAITTAPRRDAKMSTSHNPKS